MCSNAEKSFENHAWYKDSFLKTRVWTIDLPSSVSSLLLTYPPWQELGQADRAGGPKTLEPLPGASRAVLEQQVGTWEWSCSLIRCRDLRQHCNRWAKCLPPPASRRDSIGQSGEQVQGHKRSREQLLALHQMTQLRDCISCMHFM